MSSEAARGVRVGAGHGWGRPLCRVTVPPEARRPRWPAASPAARAHAVWLAMLAACRGGLLKELMGKTGDLQSLLHLSADQVRAGVGPPRRGKTAPDEREESRFRRLLAAGPGCVDEELGPRGDVCVLTWHDAEYPDQLRQVKDAPPALFVRGRVADGLRDLRHRPVVAIVGARGASPYGRDMARALARDLTDAGVLVVSGMAMGIDAIAQQEAVASHERAQRSVATLGPQAAPHTSTVAVLGCGIGLVYPRVNARLAARILDTGLILSEFPGHTPASAWRFPCRNRVIAGLARAVVVVEGDEHSGSLLTAWFALELGRDVLAVPGEAGRRLSAGPHSLLRQGGHLCESADDVLDVIGLRGLAWSTLCVPGRQVEGPLGTVLAELDGAERSVDQLSATLGCGQAEVAALLSRLEVDGLVERADQGRYRVRRGKPGGAGGGAGSKALSRAGERAGSVER